MFVGGCISFKSAPKTSLISDNHFVRVTHDVDVVNVSRKTAKSGERPAFFSVHVDSYAFMSYQRRVFVGGCISFNARASFRVI